jgi:Leucine-rich repeat (LRR) protein
VCDLSGNLLTELPSTVGMLGSLRVLFLQQNRLMELPRSFAQLPALENLSLTGNRVDIFPQHAMASLRQLKTLTYAENRLKAWGGSPDNQDKHDESEEPVHKNEATSGVFGVMTAIEYLDLNDNALVQLPASGWAALTVLVELRLSHNKLTHVPTALGSLPSLQRLDLSHNKLSKLPPELFSHSHLVRLDLRGNSLHKLPSTLGSAAPLESLFLQKNPPLLSLPETLAGLKRLTWLEIDKACFLALSPAQLAFCESLATFSAE